MALSRKQLQWTWLFACCWLSGCGSVDNFAPVSNAGDTHIPRTQVVRHARVARASHKKIRRHQATKRNHYQVRRGDTLYSIAWRYNLDYRDLAARNGIAAPYTLALGQRLRLHGRAHHSVRSHPTQKKSHRGIISPPRLSKGTERRSNTRSPHWQWPVTGPVVTHFSPRLGNKGIEIAAPDGTQVRAAADGRVAYAGSGLRAYGNLLIIKHNNAYLSAYAHNRELLVKEGQSVSAGQAIATMGSSRRHGSRLHFEIRHAGIPIDPLRFLKAQRLASNTARR